MEEKLEKIVKEVEELNALEISQLVKALEEKFGVSAAPMMAASPATAGSEAVVAEEKTSFNVILKEVGGQKIQVIKIIRELTGKGLKEAKDLVDAAPQVVKEGVSKNEAEELKKKIEETGATAEIK